MQLMSSALRKAHTQRRFACRTRFLSGNQQLVTASQKIHQGHHLQAVDNRLLSLEYRSE
jgi:hypothetical protein